MSRFKYTALEKLNFIADDNRGHRKPTAELIETDKLKPEFFNQFNVKRSMSRSGTT